MSQQKFLTSNEHKKTTIASLVNLGKFRKFAPTRLAPPTEPPANHNGAFSEPKKCHFLCKTPSCKQLVSSCSVLFLRRVLLSFSTDVNLPHSWHLLPNSASCTPVLPATTSSDKQSRKRALQCFSPWFPSAKVSHAIPLSVWLINYLPPRVWRLPWFL